jgi:hypothetical protein
VEQAQDRTTTTIPYSTHAFNALPEFGDSKARFSQKQHVLDELGRIIRRHGLQKHVGAALIHKHFPLQAGERVVESVSTTHSILRAVDTSDETALVPYLWHLSRTDNDNLEWTPVEFVFAADVNDQVRKLASAFHQQNTLLTELGNVIAATGAQETIGISILHRQIIDFDRDEQILLESPGAEDRTLVVLPVARKRTADDDYTQTYWHFDIEESAIEAGCSQHGCAGYCNNHT